MEGNKKEGPKQGGSNDQRIHLHVTLNNNNNNINNELREIDDFHLQFDMYNLRSLQISPQPIAATFGIHDLVVMTSKGSCTKEESSKKLSVHSDVKSSSGVKRETTEDQCHWKGKFPKMGRSSFLVKRAMSPQELFDLAKVDPKKAKRILANRLSATKSKERKKHYAKKLEERVKRLQAQSDNINQQLAICKRNIATRIARNNELKRRIEALGQQLQQKWVLREAMRKELEYYMMKNNQYALDMVNDPSASELLSKFSSMLALRRQCPNLPPLPPTISFGQPFNELCGPSFYNFNGLN